MLLLLVCWKQLWVSTLSLLPLCRPSTQRSHLLKVVPALLGMCTTGWHWTSYSVTLCLILSNRVFSWADSSEFDQNSSPVSFKDSSISTLAPPPIPWPPRTEVSQDTCPAFTGLRKIWTRIFMIVWHPLWGLNHLPGLVLFIIIFEHRMVLIEALLLLNCPFNWNIDEEPSRG